MTMLLSVLTGRVRKAVELITLVIATAFSGFMTYHAMLLVQDSWAYNEVSTGIIPVPLAYPQASMALGLLVLTVALADEVACVARTGHTSFGRAEQEITLGKDA
jgi:TRAP-type C4-dicarboxylate transport system permease small subunit